MIVGKALNKNIYKERRDVLQYMHWYLTER